MNSCLKLKPINKLFERNALFKTKWNWFYVRLLNAVFDFRLFDYVRLFKCSISKSLIVFDRPSFWVSSIVFHCRTQWKWIERLEFDCVQLPNVRLTTPGKKYPYRKVRWQYFFVYLTKNWVLWQILIMSNVKAIISNHNKREFIVNPRALMKRERAAILQQTQHLPHGWKLSRSK